MVVALVTPPTLVATGLRVLAHDWFVRFEYDRGGFPSDRFGLTRPQRERLALIGLASIRPRSEGIVLLEHAELPDGSRAFDGREKAHMRDVRHLLGVVYRLQLLAIALIGTLAIVCHRLGRARAAVPRGLLAGALITIGLVLLVIPIVVLGFDGFFVRFHELFFDGSSWRFAPGDTLLRLYPERFWQDTAQLIAAIAVAQALVLAPLAWWGARRAGRSGAA